MLNHSASSKAGGAKKTVRFASTAAIIEADDYFNDDNDNAEIELSAEEKLKMQVIESNLKAAQKRKTQEALKALRKGRPPVAKSKNLISLV